MNPSEELKMPEENGAQTYTTFGISEPKPNDGHMHNWVSDGNLITSQRCGQCGVIRLTPENEYGGERKR